MTAVLLLGERSNRPAGYGSAMEMLPSSSRARLDRFYPGWQERLIFRNVWQDQADKREGKARVREILAETQPEYIISLGITVSLLLDVPYETSWLAETTLSASLSACASASASASPTSPVRVLKFPHPSGRARAWNDKEFEARAQEKFAQLASTAVRPKNANTNSETRLIKSENVENGPSSDPPHPFRSRKVSARSESDSGAQDALSASTGREVAKSPSVGSEDHQVKTRYFKVYEEHVAECGCGWAATTKKKQDLDSQIEWHVEKAKPLSKARKKAL